MAINQNNSDTEESFSNSSSDKPNQTLQIILDLQKDLKTAADSLRLELLGIHKEIDEIKSTLSVLRDFLFDRKDLTKPSDETVGAISDSLDLLQAPQHLRRTLEVIMILNRATASQVAQRTGKSRSLESDYLNQLERRGILNREEVGKRVFFVHERTRAEEENGDDTNTNSNSIDIQQMQQTVRDSKE